MTSITALLLCAAAVVAGFVFEQRDRRARVTFAAWLPCFWIAINASRDVSKWLMIRRPQFVDDTDRLQASLAGNLVDQVVLSSVIALGVFVIVSRRGAVARIIQSNRWLLVFVLYLGLSVAWSDVAAASLRRWVGLFGHVVMAGVLASEPVPVESVRSVCRRCAYFLIPVSVLFVKWFPSLGVLYKGFVGKKIWIGAAIMKNGLGHLSLVFTFFVIWDLVTRSRRTRPASRLSSLFDAAIVILGLWLLYGEGERGSAAAIGCMALAIAMLAVSRLQVARRAFSRSAAVMAVGAGLLFLMDSLFGIVESLVAVLGRNMTFTGRVPLWDALTDLGFQRPWFGYGFGGFWIPSRATEIAERAASLTQAHNGYFDIFLEGGSIGIALFLAVVVTVALKIQRTDVNSYDYGVFRLTLFAVVLITSVTESSLVRERGLMTVMFFVIAMNDGVPLESWRDGTPSSDRTRRSMAGSGRRIQAGAAGPDRQGAATSRPGDPAAHTGLRQAFRPRLGAHVQRGPTVIRRRSPQE